MLTRTLILANLLQFAILVGLTAGWVCQADGASLRQIIAISGAAFAGALAAGLGIWNAMSRAN
ncbi:hypothetical protein BJY16_005360 [Actinoplanes octamycinicus]|uniref:Uncharacterized protein n=1 Tax=Actinoplanes octamycinicus TaxID=135948 RepID=A0A7W7M9I7_9ACTN|nr:hypothetical protein [Actinoplanes octamycinicus]MBB4741901.1 hypothetical protein [Actinoplanes octamycinicus]GIE60664.1 hypothetical protein Aoc01nite_60660 [Actinoplanes octamycinicus]